jgi:hypothetical protein
MSKTLLVLRNDVRHYLDENTEADWLDSDLTRIINKHYQRVATAAMETFENYYITESTTDTDEDVQEYELPSDFWKMRRVEINYNIADADSTFSRALPIDLDQVRGNLENTNTGVNVLRNPTYYLQGNIIGFRPIPDAIGDEAIKIWYVKQVPDMTLDTDTIDIPYPDRYYGIITKAAAAEALRKGQQEPVEAKRLEDEAQADIDRMKRELEDRVAEESKMVIDVSGESLDFGGSL